MKNSIGNLFHALMQEVRTLIRQEILLVKTETSETLSRMRRDGVALAVGGCAAYAGLIVLLMSLGVLVGWAFTIVGLAPLLAGFVGLAIVGLLVCGIGAMVAMKAVHALSHESIVPEKSVAALHHLKASHSPAATAEAMQPPKADEQRQPKRSPEELKRAAFATEDALDQTFSELRMRLSPRALNARLKERAAAHRYSASLIAMGLGLVGSVIVRRRARHA